MDEADAKHTHDLLRQITVVLARGYDLRALRCREITAGDYRCSNFILAMDRKNLTQIEAR